MSTVDTQNITNFYTIDVTITLNGAHGRFPFYDRDSRSGSDPDPIMLFPQGIFLKEFRIMPVTDWDPQASFTRHILWVNDVPIVEHMINTGETFDERNAPRLFDIQGPLVGTILNPGGFCYLEAWGAGSDPSDTITYQYQMWGEYIR